MKFVSAYDYKPPIGEKMDEHSLVETAGYVPTEKKIQQMMMAGERLLTVTADQYDYSGDYDEDDFDIDPTRSGNFDLVDGQRILADLEAKKQAYEEALKASQIAQNGTGEGEKTPSAVVTTPPAE